MYKPRGSVPNWSLFRLAPVAFVLVSAFAAAQQQPSCVPNTANYPCVYVANGGNGTVSVINAATNKVIGAVSLGPSTTPQGLAITPDNAFVYVAVDITGLTNFPAVEVIDTATGTVSGTVAGLNGQSPTQVAITPDGKFAYVVEAGSGIDRIDTGKNTVVDSVAGLTFPSAIVIAPSGALAYVADVCSQVACVDIVDTTITPPTVTSSVLISTPTSNFTGTGSIAITPDGSVVCVSVVDPSLKVGVGCINTANDSLTELDLGTFVGLTSYGLAATPNGTMYGAEPGDPSGDPLSVVAEIDPNTTPPTLLKTIQVGLGPTGVAIGPGGLSVYVSDASDSTVSIIDAATNGVVILGSANGFSNPQGVAAMLASPPVITTQPASQIISPGQTATMSVVATSAAPFFYQWFQGISGDTSFPIRGAVGNSFTTPALVSTTSYWVQVLNVAGAVNSNTATVAVTSNQPPTCVLSVAGNGTPDFSNPVSVTATATCVDPQGEALTTTIDFGDGASSTSGNNGVFSASHTYAAYTQPITYPIVVTAVDISELQSAPAQYSWTLVPTALAPPVFAGQSSNVTVTLTSAQSQQVTFECTTVTTSTGQVTQASALGITCSSNPPKITLFASQAVTIVIQTTGGASASLPSMRQETWSYAFLLPLPIFALLGVGFNSIRSHHVRFSSVLLLSGVLALAIITDSCGGGFTAPKVIQATPAGNYQVTIIDVPVGTPTSGFVQTSLIVPLTVSPFQ